MFREDVAVPKNPESEGSRLITLKQIELEHGVSRSALHTYRRSASFPQPVQVEGSTKVQYRADEVADWFETNPPQQGRRTDLASKQQGEPAVIEGQMGTTPLNGNDARAILGIVWKWIENVNDGLGPDVGDLQHDLEAAGYGPVDTEESEAP
jgi:predicted DNA-binding transcriptional regulator AlpA